MSLVIDISVSAAVATLVSAIEPWIQHHVERRLHKKQAAFQPLAEGGNGTVTSTGRHVSRNDVYEVFVPSVALCTRCKNYTSKIVFAAEGSGMLCHKCVLQ